MTIALPALLGVGLMWALLGATTAVALWPRTVAYRTGRSLPAAVLCAWERAGGATLLAVLALRMIVSLCWGAAWPITIFYLADKSRRSRRT
ncbi:hypothetical protein [Spongiactinospora sp. TRM90649]|uniref:hypothetical protein n=1 Tax=Spongiactinospora sp. TRM90649 TaxID=3031114 RepID=UPI0023F88B81|nr:hypothetical protein [Spongiactinospora sp. TRM90649]MDF5756609.1 hypothetical protein [Spongiactinospora sp. TRM90649]